MEYASKGVGAAGLTTGIIGTALGGLLTLGNGGGLLGMGGNCCSDNMAVNRYESSLNSKISELETEVKLRDANFYTLTEMGKLRDYVDGKFDKVDCELKNIAIYNTANTSTVNCLANQVAQLYSLTKLVVPNGSICPGWGNVTVAPATTTTT